MTISSEVLIPGATAEEGSPTLRTFERIVALAGFVVVAAALALDPRWSRYGGAAVAVALAAFLLVLGPLPGVRADTAAQAPAVPSS